MAKDTPENIAFNDAAPQGERYDAQAEMQKAHTPTALSDLLPRSEIQPVIDYIMADLEDQSFNKALRASKVIPFPSKAVASGQKRGMQSVNLDDWQINIMGDWYEKQGLFTFDTMRAMVDQTPILSSVILTRQRQIKRFCRPPENGRGPGFEVRLRDRDKQPSAQEKESVKLLQQFFMNCGWESNPRRRMRLKRANFTSFMAMQVRDSLILDSAPIETEFKRDRSLGMDGFYAVDGATIRLCSEHGYQGDDEIFALQVVQGRIRAAYTYDDLIYVPRNPRTDVQVGGYGMSETELLIRVVTGFLNAFTYNLKYFDGNTIPKGMLHLTGNYDEKDLQAFKRYWNAMVKGIDNRWTMPDMVSKDQESRAAFEKFGVDVDEMMFSKWMTFLASIVCAIYGIGPDEINFESFSAQKSALSGNDTEAKLTESKDKGLLPLLSYFEDTFTDFIVADFSDKFVFRWTGFDDQDEKQAWEEDKLCLSVNELRARRNYEPVTESWGDAPLNPSLVGVWTQQQQQANQDFGNPPQGGQPGDDYGDAPQGGADQGADFGSPNEGEDDEQQGADELAKSFGLPVFKIEV